MLNSDPSLNGEIVTADGVTAGRPLLVMFLSNHCPYVRYIERELGSLVAEDVAAVAICSNDTETYPADGPDGLTEQVHRAGFTFPYLRDDTQEVALAYRGACTPDFFLYDAGHSSSTGASSMSPARATTSQRPAKHCAQRWT